jgi:hypothetical protein
MPAGANERFIRNCRELTTLGESWSGLASENVRDGGRT